MFTGIIEELGTVRTVQSRGRGARLTIAAHIVLDDLKIDDSIAVNGVCQTVVAHTSSTFDVEAVEETVDKTTFGSLRPGQQVNLERAMRLGGRLGGHLVQGHVDCRGTVLTVEELPTSRLVWVEFPEHYTRYVIPVGSICIDGISLTAARVEGNRVMVSIIPHTWKSTTIHAVQPGTEVNLEFDMLGKYIEKIMTAHIQPGQGGLTAERLRELGY